MNPSVLGPLQAVRELSRTWTGFNPLRVCSPENGCIVVCDTTDMD